MLKAFRRRAKSAGHPAPAAHLEHRNAVAPLFDAHYYCERYPDVAASGSDPLAHYVANGWTEGREPHPLFDAAWYLEINEDVRAAGVDPLRHYMASGWKENRRPHILFDIAHYQERYGVGSESGENPLLHYLSTGWLEGNDPHPLFAVTWYLCREQEVAQALIEPLGHYLTKGWTEGARPNPAFDPQWYLSEHKDVGRQNPEPLTHYLKHGVSEGRAATALLDERRQERGRAPQPGATSPLEDYVKSRDYLRDHDTNLFDARYYRALNADLADLSDHALYRHFVTVGYAEGRLARPVRQRAVEAVPEASRPQRPTRRRAAKGGRAQYSSPLVIAGFHRSGTSMTANLLADAGLHVGEELLGAKPSNPYGHFEDLDVLRFHDEVLRQSGQTWQTTSDVPLIMRRKDWRFMIHHAARNASHAAWGFKDPRVCLFLPHWHAVFPDMAVLYVYRPCAGCVQSLRKRAARNAAQNKSLEASRAFFRQDDLAIRMWLNYSAQALRFLEGFEGRKLVIGLDDLLANRDIVSTIRADWGYRLSDVLPFDVYDGISLTRTGPNEAINDPSLAEDVAAIERRFEAILN